MLHHLAGCYAAFPFNANFLVLLQTKKKNVTRDGNDHNFDSGNKVAFY